ncbi:MAG: Arc family DNA-binding protein [Burkholderiaceae bacterium]
MKARQAKWSHNGAAVPLWRSLMSVNLSIKGVPESIAARLRERAERNHRSLQGELMALIERAAAEPVEPDAAATARSAAGQHAFASSGVRRGTKTIEQIAAEHRLLYPEPFKGGPLAVDIIRADRDSR